MPGKSWLWHVNFCILQWAFIRLEREAEDDGSTSGWNLIGPIFPLTGWWQGYVPQRFVRMPIWRRRT